MLNLIAVFVHVGLHVSLERGISVIVVEVELVEVEDHQFSHLAQLQPHFTATNVGQNVETETQETMQKSV